MKRRNFLVSLFALPFAAKVRAEPIGWELSTDIDWPEPRAYLLFEHHKERVHANTKALRELSEAIRNAPGGYKKVRGRFSAAEVRELNRDAVRFLKKHHQTTHTGDASR